MRYMPRLPRVLALSISLIPAIAGLAPAAAMAGPATQDEVLQAVVLTGWQQADGRRMAALRLDLAPGWKTYWRSPGEAGIPPQFDWSASVNVRSVRLHWPAPVVFETNGMRSIGYRDQLVLPVEVTPLDPARPVRLVAGVELGICQDICLPASLRLDAGIEGKGAPDRLIEAALQARPRSAKEAGLAGIRCRVEPIDDGLRLSADMGLPPQGKSETVAFETSDRTIWFSESVAARQGATLSASAELVAPSARPFALDRSGITLTVISERGAVEVRGCPAG